MSDIAVADIRNVALMGHTGTGKTSLIDALLFKMGIVDRLGSVVAGSSVSDYTDAEKARKISISAKSFTGIYKTRAGKNLRIVLLDTPGYMDFFGQVICASKGSDSALITVDASAGVQVGTRQAWKLCEKQQMPRAFVITGMDKENTEFAKTVEGIQATFGDKCVPVVLPKADKSGFVEVLTAKDAGPLAPQADANKTKLIELAAETNDSLIEKFLEGKQLAADELSKGLKDAVKRGSLVPIFCCMSLKDKGLAELLEGFGVLMPSPADLEVKDAEGKPIATGANDPFVGLVWRTVNDEYIGQLTFVRVLGGTLKADSEFFNATKGQKERVGVLLCLNGKKQSNVPDAVAGDIVAIPKLKFTGMGDTLCAIGKTVALPPIAFPNPVIFMAVKAKTQADEDKLGTALNRVCDEDPTLRVDRNVETHQMVIAGLGDVHVDVAVDRMKKRSNVEVLLETPRVAYRETVTAVGEGHYKHKKQSGGRGQFGEVYLRISPKKADDPEWFENDTVGGSIPGNFIPAIEKGLVEGMTAGAVAGYPITNVKISVYDGSFHEVDSSEISFKIAGGRAMKDGMTKARPVLLEPIMNVKVFIPDHFMGDINGDLNHRRGRILGISTEDGMQVITADVPQSELFKYAAELRSMTGGQGSFEMAFSRYEVVPSSVAQKVIAEANKNKKVEEEE